MENIDDSYWSDFSNKHSANIGFLIYFEESELTAEYIEKVVITAPNDVYWNFDNPETIKNLFIEGTFGRFYSLYQTDNSSIIPIGDYTFEVTYSNGRTVTKDLTVPAPGSTTVGTYAYAYTEDYTGTPGSNYIPLPKKANISSAINDTTDSEITVNFSIDDSKIYNGVLRFYDSAGNYITSTDYFVDWEDGTLSSILNGGYSLNTNGSNTVIVSYSDLEFDSDESGSDISFCHIILTDGKQYDVSDINIYDCRSISEKFEITVN